MPSPFLEQMRKLNPGYGEALTPQIAMDAARAGANDEWTLRRLWIMRDEIGAELEAASKKGTQPSIEFYDWMNALSAVDEAIASGLERLTTPERQTGALIDMARNPLSVPLTRPVPLPAARISSPPPTPSTHPSAFGGEGILPPSYASPPGMLRNPVRSPGAMGMSPRDFVSSPAGPLAISRPRADLPYPPPSEFPSPQKGFIEKLLAVLSLLGKQQAPPAMPVSPAAAPPPMGGPPGPGWMKMPTTMPSAPGIPMSSPEYGIASENRQAATMLPQTPANIPDWLRRLFGAKG